MNVRIEASWREALAAEFDKLYFGILTDRIRSEYQSGRAIYPPAGQIFRALDLCPLDRVRVVILGQDPYHGAGQAEGLAFSVPPGIAVPPSLVNIKREIADDLGRPSIIKDGELLPWVEQGVLLLNTTLTVRSGEAASHQGLGWETFTDAVIQLVSQHFQLGPLPHVQGQLLADPLHHVGTPLGRVLTPPVRSARAMPTPGARSPEPACRCSGSHQDHGRQANQNAFDSHDVTSSGSAGPWRHLVGTHVCPDPVMPGRTGIQHVWAEVPEAR